MWKSKALVVFSRSFCLKLQKSKTIASFIIENGEGEIQFSWIENFAVWMSLWVPYTLYALILSIISQLFFPCLQWGLVVIWNFGDFFSGNLRDFCQCWGPKFLGKFGAFVCNRKNSLSRSCIYFELFISCVIDFISPNII